MRDNESDHSKRLRCWLLGLLLVAPTLMAQQTTERFIPIGQSPGVSGQLSSIGTLATFDDTAGLLRVESAEGRMTYRVTPRTRIWIDRSATGRTSLVGNRDDLAAGRRVEVMPRRDDPQLADWIKVAAD